MQNFLRGRKWRQHNPELGYHPHRWERLLDFFAGRAIPGVEAVREGENFRTVHVISGGGRPVYGWLRAGHRPRKNALRLTLDGSLLPVLAAVQSKVCRLFDLNCDPEAIYERLSTMNEIQPDLCICGTRCPAAMSLKWHAGGVGPANYREGGRTLAGRFAGTIAFPQSGIEALPFPTPESILAWMDQ